MADIVAFVGAVAIASGQFRYTGSARTSDMADGDSVSWSVDVATDAQSMTVNVAIRDAAIAAAVAAGHTVGNSDKKTIVAGAV